jgi:hypothetical protein
MCLALAYLEQHEFELKEEGDLGGRFAANVGEGLVDDFPDALNAAQGEKVDEGDLPPIALFGNGRGRYVSELCNRQDSASVVPGVGGTFGCHVEERLDWHVVAGASEVAEHPGVLMKRFLQLGPFASPSRQSWTTPRIAS